MADPFAELEAQSNQQQSSATGEEKKDPFADLETKAAPKAKGEPWYAGAGRSFKAFASAIPQGLAEPVEQTANVIQYANKHTPSLPFAGFNPLFGDPSDMIRGANALAGASQSPYMNVVGHYNRTPQAFLGGQTPNEAQQGHPYATGLGNMVGALPTSMIGGAEGAALPLAGRIARGAGIGAGYGAGFGGLGSAADQAQANDTINPQDVAQSMLVNGLAGAGLGALGGLFHEKTPKVVPPEEPPKLLGYNKSSVPQALKALPYNKPSVIAPPGPTERLIQRGKELFEEPQKIVQGKVIKEAAPPPGGGQSESWRQPRDIRAREATPREDKLIRGVAEAKLALDQAAAKLEGALREADKNLQTRPFKSKMIAPSNYKLLQDYRRQHGGIVTGETTPHLEATLSNKDKFWPFHQFATDNPAKEIAGLTKDFLAARREYMRAKVKARDAKIPLNEMLGIQVHDEAGNVRQVNVQMRQQAAPNSIKFPTPELQKGYDELRAKLQEPYTEQFWSTFDKFLEKELTKGNELVTKMFSELHANTQAKLLLGIGLAATYYLTQNQRAEATPEVPPTLVGRVLKSLKKVDWDEAQGFRPVSRITGTQLTSDVIRQGFDKASRDFARLRDTYFAELNRKVTGARHLTEAEEEKLADEEKYTGRAPDVLTTPILNGWTPIQRLKLAQTIMLHDQYTKDLRNEIARVDKLGTKPNDFNSLTGMSRYARMLQEDLKDMGGTPPSQGGLFSNVVDKLTGSAVSSISYGNYRMASMHVLESVVAYGSKHPVASAQTLAQLATNKTYREYAVANSPPGMFQRILEGQDNALQLKFVTMLNEKFDQAIKALPGGEVIHGTLSAQLPERAKLGLGATITAHANAKDYPGGPEQFMKDWLGNAKNNAPIPVVRQAKFAAIEVENFIDQNKAVMFTPEGKLQERTMFQRHGQFFRWSFPFLRAIVQQTRFFASLFDDGIAAARMHDMQQLAKVSGAFLLGHILVATVAGSHVVPDYVWAILESIDKDDAVTLKGMIDDYQSALTGGYQIQDFGLKYLPYFKMHGLLLSSQADSIARGLARPKEAKDVAKSMISLLAMSLISRIGPAGTTNLMYIWERIERGVKGSEEYKRYTETPLLDKAMGRPFATKLYDKKLPFDITQGLLHSVLKVENPLEVKANARAEEKGAKLIQKDFKKIGKNYQKVLYKL